MRVWIDQAECTGAGLCEAIEPRMFAIDDDGLAVVRDGDVELPDGQPATVRPEFEKDVVQASQSCPGRCIVVEDG